VLIITNRPVHHLAVKTPYTRTKTEGRRGWHRLDLHHEIMSQLLDGKLYRASLEVPRRIHDIGTGTGIWAIDMADQYLMTDVIGTDLRYVMPKIGGCRRMLITEAVVYLFINHTAWSPQAMAERKYRKPIVKTDSAQTNKRNRSPTASLPLRLRKS